MTLLEALRSIRDEGPTCPEVGICPHVENTMRRDHGDGACSFYSFYYQTFVMKELFKKWPEFSGCAHFPVPAGEYGVNARDAYIATGSRYMWDRNHPYGALRWELLDFMIEELEKESTGLLNGDKS